MDSNRMRKLFLFGAFILFMTGVSAQQDSLKYRISLKDTAATEYSLKRLLQKHWHAHTDIPPYLKKR